MSKYLAHGMVQWGEAQQQQLAWVMARLASNLTEETTIKQERLNKIQKFVRFRTTQSTGGLLVAH